MVECVTPALLTGTSSEFLGRRPLPRVLRNRPTIFVLGPRGAGKTSVANRLANGEAGYVDTRQLQDDLVYRIVHKRWRPERLEVDSLVVDGPAWLRNRPAVVDAMYELLVQRASSGRRSIVIQNDADGSIDRLMDRMPAGSMVVLGLRFPKGPRGRLRFARRLCDGLGVPRAAARGAHTIEPWNYAVVVERVQAWIDAQAPRPLRHGASALECVLPLRASSVSLRA